MVVVVVVVVVAASSRVFSSPNIPLMSALTKQFSITFEIAGGGSFCNPKYREG